MGTESLDAYGKTAPEGIQGMSTVQIPWKWQYFSGDKTFRHWLESGAFSLERPIKVNAKRSVWKALAPDGKTYFIKREHRSFFSFRNKAVMELKISRLLPEKYGIDCVQFTALGRCGRDTLLVSPAVPDTVTAKEYWFDEVVGKGPVRKSFLNAMQDLLRKMQRGGLRHTDFHAGNVLVCRNSGKMILVDLVEIHPAGKADVGELAHICTDFLPDLQDSEAESVISAIAGDAPAEWLRVKENLLRMIEREWEKRKRQILSGRSKFCHTVEIGGKRLDVASDECFRPRVFSENVDCLQKQELPADEAERLWLAMFRARLEGRSPAVQYLAIERVGEKSIFYVDPGKNP